MTEGSEKHVEKISKPRKYSSYNDLKQRKASDFRTNQWTIYYIISISSWDKWVTLSFLIRREDDDVIDQMTHSPSLPRARRRTHLSIPTLLHWVDWCPVLVQTGSYTVRIHVRIWMFLILSGGAELKIPRHTKCMRLWITKNLLSVSYSVVIVFIAGPTAFHTVIFS